ncbi:hypothetical protein, partial [Streptomyces olivaceus]|uniref:hypothetical protein n=1 Tax=Streptomyces olivaceus TaxID=47716 RepID=UPI0040574D45
NKGDIIESEWGLRDVARSVGWPHAGPRRPPPPRGAQEARYALEPLVNLARLRIRDGDGTGAYHLLDSLNRAVRSKTEAVIDDRATSFQRLTKSASDHQQVCQWLWAVLLGDGTRALVAAGEWDYARAHSRQHRGVGKRLFDGRQVEVLVRCLGEQPSDALKFLHESTLVEPWEHAVAAALAVLCHRAADEQPVEPINKMVQHYLALGSAPDLAVFRSRVGLVVLDLSPESRQAELMHRLTSEATTHPDGYIARDVLAHSVCREGLSQDERRTLSTAVASAGLGRGSIPDPLDQAIRDASTVAADVWQRHASCRANAWPA